MLKGTFDDIDNDLLTNVQGQTASVLSTLVLAEGLVLPSAGAYG